MNKATAQSPGKGARQAAGVAIVGLVAAALLALVSGGRTALMQAYLLAWLYWLAIALGSLSLLLLQHVTGGRWGLAIRRPLEAAAGTLPLLALLFIPILLQVGVIYSWADPEVIAHDEIVQKKLAYLNPLGFGIRAAVYFILWIGMARLLTRWSRQQDVSDDPVWIGKLRRLSAPGLVVYALTVTFAAFDWAMSLEPHWFSSVYGVLYASGAALAAITLAILVLTRIGRREPHASFLTPETVGDLGNLTLAFTMFWTYIAISQFLIIWSGHLPEETPWYYARLRGGWEWIGGSLLVLHFGLPFLLLLPRANKRNLQKLGGIALFLLIMRFADLLWLVAPAFSPDRLQLRLLDLAVLAGLGGVWFLIFLRALAAAPLLPPRLVAAQAAAAQNAHHDAHHDAPHAPGGSAHE